VRRTTFLFTTWCTSIQISRVLSTRTGLQWHEFRPADAAPRPRPCRVSWRQPPSVSGPPGPFRGTAPSLGRVRTEAVRSRALSTPRRLNRRSLRVPPCLAHRPEYGRHTAAFTLGHPSRRRQHPLPPRACLFKGTSSSSRVSASPPPPIGAPRRAPPHALSRHRPESPTLSPPRTRAIPRRC
jgi:hypothetical protein